MLTPSQLKALDKRISANADKVISRTVRTLAPERKVKGAGRKPASFVNTILPECLDVLYAGEENWPLWADDILSGVARLNWMNQKHREIPLSARKILQCLAHLETMDTYSISHLIHVDERSAQRYYNACELAQTHMIRSFCEEHKKYPEVFVFPRENVPQTDLDE